MKDNEPSPSPVVFLFDDPRAADRAVQQLAAVGVAREGISVVLRIENRAAGFDSWIPPDEASGPVGALPASLRALPGWGALVLPGTRRLMASGPILGAIAETALCPWGSSLARALAGFAVPLDEALADERAVLGGATMIVLHDPNDHARARECLAPPSTRAERAA